MKMKATVVKCAAAAVRYSEVKFGDYAFVDG